MKGKILIVEDEFIVASDLRIILEKAGYQICGIAASAEKAYEIIKIIKPTLVFLDIKLEGKLTGIDLALQLNELEIPFIFVSANSNQSILELAKSTRPYGFLVKPFRESDVLVTLEIAIYRHEHNLEATLIRELQLQNDVEKILDLGLPLHNGLLKIIDNLQYHISFDYFSICWKSNLKGEKNGISFLKGPNQQYEYLSFNMMAEKIGSTIEELNEVLSGNNTSNHLQVYNGVGFEEMISENPFRKLISRSFDLGSALIIPLQIPGRGDVIYSFYSHQTICYQNEHLLLIDRLNLMLVRLAERILTNHVVVEKSLPSSDFPGIIEEEKVVGLPEEENSLGLIGSGNSLDIIKKQLAIVAPFDTSILILGESGTGKEKVAQAIHELSPRKSQPFVKVNCAAIPASLMESELFGYEKGAFTGAINRRIGKFEQAINGSIFLDEIGELSGDLQAKLLSVLQEKEIMRLGSNQTVKTDVRIIAATNRNLEKEVAEGRFRLDLYYRLKVFPIHLPPLRDRKEDIPELISYFIDKISRKLDRQIDTVSPQMMQVFMEYDWPGNIRELENMIERSMLMTEGSILLECIMPIHKPINSVLPQHDITIRTMKEVEKEHILAVLKKCNEKIGGAGGAAELLDMAPTTLISKMNKLGIVKRYTV